MATGTTSTNPDSPVGSSPLRRGGEPALVGWFKEISTIFLRSLSPAGATEFDETQDFDLTDTTNFELYSAASRLQVSRYGRIVEVWGTISCTTAGYIESGTEREFAQLPDGFFPKGLQRIRMPGSGSDDWLLKISTTGRLIASNYSGTQAKGVWMPINHVYRTA